MNTFDSRQQGYEALFAHSEEREFRAHAHRNRQIGLWAADLLGLEGDHRGHLLADLQALAFGPKGEVVLEQALILRLDGIASADEIASRLEEELENARAVTAAAESEPG